MLYQYNFQKMNQVYGISPHANQMNRHFSSPLETNIMFPLWFYQCQQNIQNERKKSYPINNTFIQQDFQNYYMSNSKNQNHNKKKNSTTTASSHRKSSAENPKKNLIFSKGKLDINLEQIEIEEFQNYLKNLQTTPCEFICTQKGSRDMNKNITKFPNECKTILIHSLGKDISKVMTDIYGNYFCQELIKVSNEEQISLMIHYASIDFLNITKDYSGTHVMQAILDKITTIEQEQFICNLTKGVELEMADDSNATHVLQKIIVTIPEERRPELNEVVLSNLKSLSLKMNSVCLVKKFIGSCENLLNKQRILKILSENCVEISQNPYGNYAIQYILEEWGVNECNSIVKVIADNIASLSVQKYSSNVSEKILELLKDKKKSYCLKQLFFNSKVLNVLKNKYGRYVLQKAVKWMTAQEKEEIKVKMRSFELTNQKEINRVKNFVELLNEEEKNIN